MKKKNMKWLIVLVAILIFIIAYVIFFTEKSVGSFINLDSSEILDVDITTGGGKTITIKDKVKIDKIIQSLSGVVVKRNLRGNDNDGWEHRFEIHSDKKDITIVSQGDWYIINGNTYSVKHIKYTNPDSVADSLFD